MIIPVDFQLLGGAKMPICPPRGSRTILSRDHWPSGIPVALKTPAVWASFLLAKCALPRVDKIVGHRYLQSNGNARQQSCITHATNCAIRRTTATTTPTTTKASMKALIHVYKVIDV